VREHPAVLRDGAGAVPPGEQHRFDCVHRAGERRVVLEAPLHDLNPGKVCTRRVSHQRPNLQSRGDQVPGRLASDPARRPGDEDRRYASAAFLGSLLPPSELFFSDFSDDLPSLEPSDLPSEPAFFRLP
jgi:hypothetical protein